MDDEKEVYRLWWEYLKRSSTYYKYCTFIENNPIINKIQEMDWENDKAVAAKVRVGAKHVLCGHDIFFWSTKTTEAQGTNQNIYKYDKDETMHHAFRMYFIVFSNIFSNQFEERWDSVIHPYIESSKEFIKSSDNKSVTLYEGYDFQKIAKDYISNFHWDNYTDEWDNLYNFIHHLSEYVIEPHDIALFQVDLTKGKTILMRQFSQLLDNTFSLYRDKNNLYREYIIPSGALYANELIRYLRLFDIKHTKSEEFQTNRMICRELYPNLTKLDKVEMDKGRVQICKELKYAERIIKNVEHGLFPGPYAKAKRGCDPVLK